SPDDATGEERGLETRLQQSLTFRDRIVGPSHRLERAGRLDPLFFPSLHVERFAARKRTEESFPAPAIIAARQPAPDTTGVFAQNRPAPRGDLALGVRFEVIGFGFRI